MLQKERFSRLQFPVHKITAKTLAELFEVLPGLRRYFQRLVLEDIPIDEYQNGEINATPGKVTAKGYAPKYRGIFTDDLVKIIKYIVFVYDPDSDIIIEYPNEPRLQKEAAAKEAGFKRNKDGEWSEYVQRIFDFREPAVVDWILDYFKVKKNPTWTQIKFIDEELDTLNNQRAAALLRGEVRPELMRLIKERADERESLIKRFFAEHSDFRKAAEEEMFPVSPENVYKELKIPVEVTRLRQVRDVLKDAGIEEAHN